MGDGCKWIDSGETFARTCLLEVLRRHERMYAIGMRVLVGADEVARRCGPCGSAIPLNRDRGGAAMTARGTESRSEGADGAARKGEELW